MKRFFNSGAGVILILLLVTNFLNGGLSDPKTYFLSMLIALPAIVIGLSFHEFAHAYTSYKLGDPTPMNQGRVTLNPKAHFELFGFLALIFCGFGWGNPVQINPNYYKHPRRDEFLVSIAGVTMNFIIAVVFSFVIKYVLIANPTMLLTYDTMGGIVLYILFNIVTINIMLAVFNLIPIPPLDGFGIITELFNIKKTKAYYKFYNSGFMILMVLLLFGIVSKILYPATSAIYNILLTNIIL